MDAMQKLVDVESTAKRAAAIRGLYGTASDQVGGHNVRAEVVPNTRGFTKQALYRTDWYLNGKRVSKKNLCAALNVNA